MNGKSWRHGRADTKFRCPMAITARRRRMLFASRHCSINHGRFQVAQVYEQAIQVLEEIYESRIMRIVDIQIMSETTLNKYVRQIPKTQKTAEGKFFNKQWQNVLSTNSFESCLGTIPVIILLLHSF